jgi:hypothetical protein
MRRPANDAGLNKYPINRGDCPIELKHEARHERKFLWSRLASSGGLPPLWRITEWLNLDHKNVKGLHAEAFAFLDSIKARKLRRYKKGDHGLPPYQLWAIRDQDEWAARAPVDVARAYQAQGLDDAGDDGERPAWDA